MCSLLFGGAGNRIWCGSALDLVNMFRSSNKKTTFQETQVPETQREVWSNKDSLLVEEDQVKEHLIKLDVCKSVEPEDHIHEFCASCLVSLQGRSWLSLKGSCIQDVFLKTGKADILEKGNCGLVSLPSGWIKLILETISRSVKDRKIIRSFHPGFMKKKSCLRSLYNEVTGLESSVFCLVWLQ